MIIIVVVGGGGWEVLAAGYEAVLAAAIPRRHLLVPLHVVVRAQHPLHRCPSLRVHPSPFRARILEPNLGGGKNMIVILRDKFCFLMIRGFLRGGRRALCEAC